MGNLILYRIASILKEKVIAMQQMIATISCEVLATIRMYVQAPMNEHVAYSSLR
jgi:hypothetical protein